MSPFGPVRWFRGSVYTGVALVFALGSGCAIEFLPGGNADAGGAGSGSDVRPDQSRVVVRLRNLADNEPVDVDFYAMSGVVSDVEAELFLEEHSYGDGIGLGANGRLAAGEEAVIELDCQAGLTLGTTGGTFLDLVTGEERGTGTLRWVMEGAQFSCGAIVVFEFSPADEGYQTRLFLVAG